MNKQWIAILDYGSQYTQLIARRIREMEVYSEIIRCDTTAEELKQNPPAGICKKPSGADNFTYLKHIHDFTDSSCKNHAFDTDSPCINITKR